MADLHPTDVVGSFSPFDERLADLDVREAVHSYAREQCPVRWSEALDGFWMVSGYDEVVAALTDVETFSSGQGVRIPSNPARPLMPPIDVDPPEHRHWRRLLNPFLAPSALAAQRSTIRSIARELVDSFVDRERFDVMADFAEPYTAFVVGRILLGIDDAQRLRDIQLSNHGIAQGHDKAESEENWRRLRSYVEELIDQRIAAPRTDDLVSTLVRADLDGHPVSRDEAVHTLMIVILGGLDTVSDAIGSICYVLARRPDLTDQVADPAWMRSHLDEFLRFYSPVDHEGRTVCRATTLGGESLQTGDKVMLLFGSANRDRRAFERPDELDLDRPSNRHVAFGLGPHRCVGSHLARLEIEVAFEELLSRVGQLSLQPGEQVRWKYGLSFGPKRLPMDLTLR